MGQIGLHHGFWIARIGHIESAEIFRRALMREPEDAAAIRRNLDGHSFAHAAETVELVVREKIEIPGHRPAGGLSQRPSCRDEHELHPFWRAQFCLRRHYCLSSSSVRRCESRNPGAAWWIRRLRANERRLRRVVPIRNARRMWQ